MVISADERLELITTAEVYALLDTNHCDYCEAMGTGLQAWWTDPNTIQGNKQLDSLANHFKQTNSYTVKAKRLWG